MIERIDDLGRILRLEKPARRIVCLVPSITETLFALERGDSVVGITDFCIHPAGGVAGKERIGGPKSIIVERILALDPDLVIANAEENRRHHIEELEGAGIPVFVTFPKTVAGCMKMLQDVAALVDSQAAVEPILRATEGARSLARSRMPKVKPRVLCPVWKDPYMTVSHDTFVDSIVRESGGCNIFAGQGERYPRFTLDEAARCAPDIILLPTEPYHFTQNDFADFEAMGRGIPAVRNRRIHIVEGELLTWYGPRTARALQELSALFSSV